MVPAAVLLALPAAGLVLLLATPGADAHWEQHPTHFWLVLATALVNVVLGLAASEAARRRADARALLVSLAFLASAGFLALHALATPGPLVEGKNLGFLIATPVGLLLAAGFAAASAVDLSPARAAAVVAHERLLRGAVLAAFLVWGVISLGGVWPLHRAVPPEQHRTELLLVAAGGIALYAFATVRYVRLARRRADPLPGALAAAWVLLAEALLATAVSRSWHLSWWEWHVLMACAFGLVAYAARAGYRRGSSVTAAFGGVYLDGTLERLDARTGDALRLLVDALELDAPLAPALAELHARGLSSDEVAVLERSAREVRRIDGLFRPYLYPSLAADLEREPGLAELGGIEREVTVLFADLQGFTTFAESRPPGESISMLNEYWPASVPAILAAGGTIERFAGDAVMVVFNAVGDQPDHAVRALGAARAMLASSDRLAAGHEGWPRFRAGLATGPAVVGHVGTSEQRSFAAIGDTTNLAARLQAHARPGEVVVSGATVTLLPAEHGLVAAGTLAVKGRATPVETFVGGR